MTVFVGPNNSGKSRALKEIEEWVTRPQPPVCQVIQNVEFSTWELGEFEAELARISVEPEVGEVLNTDNVLIGKLRPQDNSAARFQLYRPGLIEDALDPNRAYRGYYGNYLSLYTLRLDGRSRLSLIDDKPSGDLLRLAPNHLAKLFVDSASRKEVRRIVYEAFGKHLVVDPTNIGLLRLRLSNRAPRDDREEQGWDEISRAFHSAAPLLSEASDGVKAFVGMVTTLIAGEPRVTLVDEPEAFLHPTLAARLGKEITSALSGTNRRLFVSTHSSSFLMGCVQGGAAINIVRVTYDGHTSTARLLTQERLIPLMRNPLLRSIGVLDALFYNAVVVTEADADRAFYQEINERLLQAHDPRGIEGCLFLNAQNKQTVWDIVQPLRELGIPAAGIVDIDVLKEGGAVWAKPMKGAFVPEISHGSLGVERNALLQAFSKTGKDMKKHGGIALLAGEEREACNNFLAKLAEYGIFVVPTGKVESWLASVKISRGKSGWLATVFEIMGEDPLNPSYVRPGDGDVWDFIGDIASWVRLPKRKGVPD
ncbi:AAA family ATPase [Pseudoduganella armeniaca]|uniref:AAA family ATPase n=1 Tax=Pseudoduganella armeniaca TaxID=2072590 RepID=UPI001C62F38D|nr:ATP-binding protein [Pseudoduganella armeniaca]